MAESSIERAGIDRGQKLSTLVAQEIADRYLLGTGVREGIRLPTEREMMEQFQVGRTTVREALRLLELRGLISIRPGRTGGPVSRRPQVESLSEALTLILQVEQASLQDVIDARLVLEPVIAGMAAQRITDEQLAQLGETVQEMRVGADSNEIFASSNWHFHSMLATVADTVVLRIYLSTLSLIADGTFAGVQYGPAHHCATADAHERIVTALQQRDASAAEAAMHEHMQEVATFWSRRYGELMSKPIRWRL